MDIRCRIAECQCGQSNYQQNYGQQPVAQHNNVKANKDNDDKINENFGPFSGVRDYGCKGGGT